MKKICLVLWLICGLSGSFLVSKRTTGTLTGAFKAEGSSSWVLSYDLGVGILCGPVTIYLGLDPRLTIQSE